MVSGPGALQIYEPQLYSHARLLRVLVHRVRQLRIQYTRRQWRRHRWWYHHRRLLLRSPCNCAHLPLRHRCRHRRLLLCQLLLRQLLLRQLLLRQLLLCQLLLCRNVLAQILAVSWNLSIW